MAVSLGWSGLTFSHAWRSAASGRRSAGYRTVWTFSTLSTFVLGPQRKSFRATGRTSQMSASPLPQKRESLSTHDLGTCQRPASGRSSRIRLVTASARLFTPDTTSSAAVSCCAGPQPTKPIPITWSSSAASTRWSKSTHAVVMGRCCSFITPAWLSTKRRSSGLVSVAYSHSSTARAASCTMVASSSVVEAPSKLHPTGCHPPVWQALPRATGTDLTPKGITTSLETPEPATMNEWTRWVSRYSPNTRMVWRSQLSFLVMKSIWYALDDRSHCKP